MYSREQVFSNLEHALVAMEEQGYDVVAYKKTLYSLPLTWDALIQFGDELANAKKRSDYPYVEPDDWAEIRQELKNPPQTALPLSNAVWKEKIRAAFLTSVCGCILGKPVEFDPDMNMLRRALEKTGEWPLNDYISDAALDHMARSCDCRNVTSREKITFAAADDDINYTVLGMLALEKFGFDFTHQQLAGLWGTHLPLLYTFGPEREMLLRFGETNGSVFDERWPDTLNPNNELCGAMIRADAYGYACAGDPLKAAQLAWRDGELTHRKTGVYGEMFAAAAIAAAFTAPTPMAIFETALTCVPARSRFAERAARGIEIVRAADNYFDAYEMIHKEFGVFTNCRIYQETATLINAVCHASDAGDGICKQVMQGNDTDSYGCTAGSILGAYFGPDGLDERWLRPFGDKIQLGLACAPESSLSALADRMTKLADLEKTSAQ